MPLLSISQEELASHLTMATRSSHSLIEKKALKAREARVNPLQGTGSVFMIKIVSQDQELNYDEVPFPFHMVVHILRKAHGKSPCLATRGTAFALRKRPFS